MQGSKRKRLSGRAFEIKLQKLHALYFEMKGVCSYRND